MQNQIYLIRFGHTEALLLRKKGHGTTIFPVLQKLTHMCIWRQTLNNYPFSHKNSDFFRLREGMDRLENMLMWNSHCESDRQLIWTNFYNVWIKMYLMSESKELWFLFSTLIQKLFEFCQQDIFSGGWIFKIDYLNIYV